ncbi:MAG: tryptophan-rich sensory protein [Clostridia bacterium]|nr:tryptophan-rich sensory protein [Clostridia bacterium]
MQSETKKNIKTYIIAILIPVAVGLISAFITKDSMQIYSELQTPPLSPPSILFPIVWSILYVLMGISSAIIWTKRDTDPKNADKGIAFYALSLAFNFVWSIIFFNLRQFLFAFVWLLALLYLIIRTVSSYEKVSKAAAYLQIPYMLWVMFAGYLNFGIWFLNR